jgi:hypothetical protein
LVNSLINKIRNQIQRKKRRQAATRPANAMLVNIYKTIRKLKIPLNLKIHFKVAGHGDVVSVVVMFGGGGVPVVFCSWGVMRSMVLSCGRL